MVRRERLMAWLRSKDWRRRDRTSGKYRTLATSARRSPRKGSPEALDPPQGLQPRVGRRSLPWRDTERTEDAEHSGNEKLQLKRLAAEDGRFSAALRLPALPRIEPLPASQTQIAPVAPRGGPHVETAPRGRGRFDRILSGAPRRRLVRRVASRRARGSRAVRPVGIELSRSGGRAPRASPGRLRAAASSPCRSHGSRHCQRECRWRSPEPRQR